MAYDKELDDRIRENIARWDAVSRPAARVVQCPALLFLLIPGIF
jgi:hypothetical protein